MVDEWYFVAEQVSGEVPVHHCACLSAHALSS